MAKDDLKTPLLQSNEGQDPTAAAKEDQQLNAAAAAAAAGAGSSLDPTAAAKADQVNVAAAGEGSSQDQPAAAKEDQQLNAAAAAAAAAAGGSSQDQQKAADAESAAEAEARAKARAKIRAEILKEEAEAKRAEDDRAQAEKDAKAQADQEAQEAQEAAGLEIARTQRMTLLSEGLQRVHSIDFFKRISPDHQKVMKELIDERSKLDEKAITLRDKCSGITTPLFAYITGTVTLYGVVNVAMLTTDLIGLWRVLTLGPFFYLLNYFKETALDQLQTMKEEEMSLIQNKRRELIRKMNQLRCSIDLAAIQDKKIDDEMKIPEGDQVTIPDHVKSARKINEEAVGDNFHMDCERILAMIPESYFETTKHKINATFISGMFVLLILGISFLVHAFLYFFIPRSGPAPPPSLHQRVGT